MACHALPSLLLDACQKQNRELTGTKARLAALDEQMNQPSAALGPRATQLQPAGYAAP